MLARAFVVSDSQTRRAARFGWRLAGERADRSRVALCAGGAATRAQGRVLGARVFTDLPTPFRG